MRDDIILMKEKVIEMIAEKETKQKICEFLNCRITTLNSYLIKWDIVYKGKRGGSYSSSFARNINCYLSNKTKITSHRLKIKLIKCGLKEHKCENCELTEWLGDLIPIELHHIDGNRFNNNLDNLQILCPNCHSKTDNNSGKGQKKFKKNIKPYKNKKCDCGIDICGVSSLCKDCYDKKQQKQERPNYETLIKEIKELGYKGTGKKYNVSDNAIRKWRNNYEKSLPLIPSHI